MESTPRADLIEAFQGRTVAVIGDVLADEFVYGRVARVSREAPVLILEYDSTAIVPGGGGNAANNVASLGGVAILVGAVGGDEHGRRLLEALHPGVDRRGLVRADNRATAVKTRILAGSTHSARQQIVRIDRTAGTALDDDARAAFERRAIDAAMCADALLVSDYGSGLVTPALASRVCGAVRQARRPGPILVDTRYQLLGYRGLTVCAPNESEVEHALGIRIDGDLDALERAGRDLLERTGMRAVLVTRGSLGMALFTPASPTVHIPIVGSGEIADVTGAGDTVMAALALALTAGATFEEAARLANCAAGLAVMKRGTATVSADELRAAVSPGTLPPLAHMSI
jgi:rfaE bifunctional protein kinase chain/domain